MEYLKEWIMCLLTLVIAGSFLETAAPSGSMKKYVGFIFALILISALISPIELLIDR